MNRRMVDEAGEVHRVIPNLEAEKLAMVPQVVDMNGSDRLGRRGHSVFIPVDQS